MTKFAANLSMLFTEHPFLDRFERAAKAGFTAVEFLFPRPAIAEHDGFDQRRPVQVVHIWLTWLTLRTMPDGRFKGVRMPTIVSRVPAHAKQPSSAAAQTFWKFAQQFASAAEKVARAPRAALVEGGIKSRTLETSPNELAAELGELSEKIDEIRGRLARNDGRLVSRADRNKAQSVMTKMVGEGALVDSAAFVDRLKVSRQALSKALPRTGTT